MENSKKTFPWKLNLFDLLVLVVAVAAVVTVVFLRYREQQRQQLAQADPTQSAVTVRYTIELSNMPLEAAQAVQPGDALMERTRKENLGIVESVEVSPTKVQVKNQTTGEQYDTEVPERYTATIVVISPAVENDRSIITDGSMEIRAGGSVRVYGPGYYGSGAIIFVDRG